MAPTNPGTTNLLHWWSLDETSGNRADLHGSITLSDVNTVGYGTGKVSNGASFVIANAEKLSADSDASLQFGDESFSWGCWVYMPSVASTMSIMGKFNWSASKSEYMLKYEAAAQNKIAMDISPGAQTFTTHRWTGVISINTWYFLYAAHDHTNNLEILSVNGGTFETKAYSSGCNASTSKFQLGGMDDATYPQLYGGVIDEAYMYRRLLTQDEVTWLYNDGAGRSYADINPATPGSGKKFRIIG